MTFTPKERKHLKDRVRKTTALRMDLIEIIMSGVEEEIHSQTMKDPDEYKGNLKHFYREMRRKNIRTVASAGDLEIEALVAQVKREACHED